MEDKLIDAEVLTELKGRMKEHCVIPDVDTVLRLAPDLDPLTQDLRGLDPASYEACLSPTMQSTSVMPEPVYSKESFREFMDELIAYIEDPTPTQAKLVRTLQRIYDINVLMTDFPEQFSVKVSMVMNCGPWKYCQWSEMVPYDVADIIKKAVNC